jgi:isopentenyl phosphate kinase
MDAADAIRAELQRVSAEYAETLARLRQLEELQSSLRRSIALLTGEEPPPDVPIANVLSLRDGRQDRTRTSAVESVLREARQPLDRNDVAELLRRGGRVVSPDDVSASLTYLRRRNRVKNAGGLWMINEQSS